VDPTPHASEPGTSGPKVSGWSKAGSVVGGVFHALNLYAAYRELDALEKGQDLTPNGYWDYGVGGRMINDFEKLPEGFGSHCISARHPNGQELGPGFYEKKNGDIYKDGKLQFMSQGRLFSGA
jgi:hypothetical protein